jgi:hypothetical protein
VGAAQAERRSAERVKASKVFTGIPSISFYPDQRFSKPFIETLVLFSGIGRS